MFTGFGFGPKEVMESGQRVADFGLGRESVMGEMEKGAGGPPIGIFFMVVFKRFYWA